MQKVHGACGLKVYHENSGGWEKKGGAMSEMSYLLSCTFSALSCTFSISTFFPFRFKVVVYPTFLLVKNTEQALTQRQNKIM